MDRDLLSHLPVIVAVARRGGFALAAARPSGLLRINASNIAIPLAVTPVVAAMAERYPDITVEIFADQGLVDIVGEGFDAGIRLGEMIAQDMVAIRL
ncbi:MAG: hypothetical protein E5W75_13650, partial [Mesorhizobium sp.]